jgi:hypothetical protein
MRETLGPWIPAIFCAILSSITVVGNLFLAFAVGRSQAGLDMVFYCFLPMCFFFVSAYLSNPRKENLALRTRIDQLASESSAKNHGT